MRRGGGGLLLNEAQFEALLEQIRAHPDASVAPLRAAGIADDDGLAAVAEHHEHVGGGVYPRGHAEAGAAARPIGATLPSRRSPCKARRKTARLSCASRRSVSSG